MLDRQQVPASFFIPAVSARAASADGARTSWRARAHEIGIHGWIHERLPTLNDEKEEQRLLDQSLETLTKRWASGRSATARRRGSSASTRWRRSKAPGFLYDSSLMASDDGYEVLLDGKPTGLVELPIERIVDDAPYFGASDGSMPSPEHVLEVFQSEFDVAWDERGLYVLTMHPHIMGHRSRVAVLERLIVT